MNDLNFTSAEFDNKNELIDFLKSIYNKNTDKIYLNLTNGLEALYELKDYNVSFIRIQSTACEQKRWDFLLSDLDYDFLFNLAIGKRCIVVDFSNNGNAKAIYYGIVFIHYILYKLWFNIKHITPYVKTNNVKKYFDSIRLLDSTKTKLKYLKKFIITDKINLIGLTAKFNNDNDYLYFKNKLKEILK